MNRKLFTEKAFGKLREVVITEPNTLPNRDSNTFFGNVETLRVWSNYGQYNENRIKLVYNGQSTNICLNSFEFFNIIKDTHYFQLHDASASQHTFVIEGRDPTGRIFELELSAKDEEIMPYIVYAILLISEIGDASYANECWQSMNSPEWFRAVYSIEDKVKMLVKLKEIAKSISSKYPFMELFFQKGLTNMVEVCRNSLSYYEIV